ncbi:hypothetical protein [Cryptosporangium arvum]|uniref:hypothetical protein n=1 Tax=Cryptosporangium arvum TaxID=80871 RepID=UPI0004BB0532|nr:hypothetical protein [Cryptosporangium arvum]
MERSLQEPEFREPSSDESDWTRYDVPYGAPYERPGTLYGRSATVYGRTVTDDDPDDSAEPVPEEPGFLGFTGVPEPGPGRHSQAGVRHRRVSRSFEAAGLPVVALGLAVLAILIGGIATVTGLIAVGRAASAESAAERAASAAASAVAAGAPSTPGVAQPVAPAPEPPAPPRPSPTASLNPDRLDPAGNYELAYAVQPVRVQPSTCEGTDLDLDEPRVLPPAGADAAYGSCADGFHLDFGESARFAVVADPQASAGGCVEAIQSDPGVGWVTPSAGTTVCVLTSRLAAEPQQLTTKLVRLTVETVENDGTLAAALTAWVVP